MGYPLCFPVWQKFISWFCPNFAEFFFCFVITSSFWRNTLPLCNCDELLFERSSRTVTSTMSSRERQEALSFKHSVENFLNKTGCFNALKFAGTCVSHILLMKIHEKKRLASPDVLQKLRSKSTVNISALRSSLPGCIKKSRSWQCIFRASGKLNPMFPLSTSRGQEGFNLWEFKEIQILLFCFVFF